MLEKFGANVLKQDKPGQVFDNVYLYNYPVRELCVYETLNYYISTTEKFYQIASFIHKAA